MNHITKRLIAVLIIAVLVLSLAACTKGSVTDQTPAPGRESEAPAEPTPTLRPFDDSTVVRITLSVDARSAFANSSLPAEVKAQLTGSGMLMSAAQLTMPLGSKLNATFRVLDISGIPVVAEETDGGTFITSIKGVANGSCGESSRWAVMINGEEVDAPVEQIELNTGDDVVFIYLCSANGSRVDSDSGSGSSDSSRATPNP